MTTKVKFNRELLKQICERDKCIVDFDKIDKYNSDVKIEFICNCGDISNKKLYQIYYGGGAYCKTCTLSRAQNKKRERFLEKYGVENPSQLEEIKAKKKQTSLCNYGTENPAKLQIVKDKYRQTCLQKYGVDSYNKRKDFQEKKEQTCLEKYGVKNPFQSEEVKTKIKETLLEKYHFY